MWCLELVGTSDMITGICQVYSKEKKQVGAQKVIVRYHEQFARCKGKSLFNQRLELFYRSLVFMTGAFLLLVSLDDCKSSFIVNDWSFSFTC
jgi:hypothetical protein